MKFMVIVLFAAVLALSGIVAYQFGQITHGKEAARTQTCTAFGRQIRTFVGLIRESEKTLPSITYYKEHPDELGRAIRQDEHSIIVIEKSLPDYC